MGRGSPFLWMQRWEQGGMTARSPQAQGLRRSPLQGRGPAPQRGRTSCEEERPPVSSRRAGCVGGLQLFHFHIPGSGLFQQMAAAAGQHLGIAQVAFLEHAGVEEVLHHAG